MVITLGTPRKQMRGCAGGAKPPPILAGLARSLCSLPLRACASASRPHPAGGLSWAFPRHPPGSASPHAKAYFLWRIRLMAAAWLNSSTGEVQPALPP